jgi:hypothetical protein
MRIFRRYSAMSMAVLLVGALLATVAAAGAALPAAAQTSTPESFAGSASATALKLSLLGINLTVGQTDAEADSTPKASADASVIAPGSLVTLGVTSASVPAGTNLTTDTTPQGCNVSAPLPSILTISALCAQSAVAIPPAGPPTVCAPTATATAPTACGSAEVLEIDVGLTQLLQPLLTAVKNATAGLSTTVGNILSNLPVVTPLLNNLLSGPLLGGLGITLADPVGSLIDALDRATELLSIKILPSVSSVATTPGAFTAASEADGIVITLLPGVLLGSDLPVLQLKVASGSTTSTYNRSTCQSSSSYIAGLLSGELLGTPLNVGLSTLNLGTLGSVTLGGGSVAPVAANGATSATADGLDVNLLNGLVALDVGHATSSVVGACAVAAPVTTTTSTTVIPPTTGTIPIVLATTGTSAPLLPIGLMLILMGYITWRIRRSRQAQRSIR